MSEVQEKQYYTNGNVTVTNKRFIVLNQTYAVSGITSVRMDEVSPNRMLEIIFCAIGAYICAKVSLGFGIILILAGIGIFFWDKTKYTVSLMTASGETQALKSVNKVFINDVINSLNQAIIDR